MPLTPSAQASFNANSVAAANAANTKAGIASNAAGNVISGVAPTIPTLTAKIANPAINTNTSAFPVVTSEAANNDLNTKQANTNELTQNVQAQGQSNSANASAQTANGENSNSLENTISGLLGSGDEQENALREEENAPTLNSAYTPQQAQSVFGSTNGMIANPDGTYNPTPQQLQQAGITDENGNVLQPEVNGVSTTTSVNDQINQLQGQMTQAFQQNQQQLQQIQQGTFPLSAPQQALLSSTQNSYQQAVNLALQANQSNVGNQEGQLASLGITGGAYFNSINNVVNEGAQQVSEIDGQMASSLANLEEGFNKDNLDIVNEEYTNMANFISSKTNTLQNMQKNLNDLYNQQITQIQTETQNNIGDLISGANFDLSSANDAITQAQGQQKITNDQANALVDQANARAQTQIAAATEGIAAATFNATYGAFVNTDGSVNTTASPTNVPGYTQLSNGSSIINGNNIPSKILDTGIQQIGGIPVIKPADVPIVNSAGNISNLISTVRTDFQQLASPKNMNSQEMQAQYKNDVAALNGAVKGLSSNPNFSSLGSLSLNPVQNDFVNQNVTHWDTGFLTSLNSLQDSVNNGLKGINPYISTPLFGQTFTNIGDVQKYATENGMTNAFNTLMQEYPNAEDFMNAINTGEDRNNQ